MANTIERQGKVARDENITEKIGNFIGKDFRKCKIMMYENQSALTFHTYGK